MTKRKNTDSFNDMLKIGLEKETLAQELIKQITNTDIKNVCNNQDYDFLTTDNKSYECKFDRYANKTRNYFIEFKRWNQKNKRGTYNTGITTTKADYYILMNQDYDDETIFFNIILTSDLKMLIDKNKYNFNCCHNFNNVDSFGYIVPITDILKFSKNFVKKNDKYYQINDI